MLKKLKSEPSAYVIRGGGTNMMFLDKTLVVGLMYVNFIEGYASVKLEPLSLNEVEIAKLLCTPARVSVITAALMSFLNLCFHMHLHSGHLLGK